MKEGWTKSREGMREIVEVKEKDRKKMDRN
jgi:hypothetical protein